MHMNFACTINPTDMATFRFIHSLQYYPSPIVPTRGACLSESVGIISKYTGIHICLKCIPTALCGMDGGSVRDGTNKDEANVNWSAWQNNNLHGRYFILGSTYQTLCHFWRTGELSMTYSE